MRFFTEETASTRIWIPLLFAKIASALAAITALVHIIVGGADALAPTLRAGLLPNASGAMHACWHIVSVFLVSSVLVFFRGGETAFHYSILWILFAIVFIYVGIYQGGAGGLIVNPQWTILLLTGLMGLAHRRKELRSTGGSGIRAIDTFDE